MCSSSTGAREVEPHALEQLAFALQRAGRLEDVTPCFGWPQREIIVFSREKLPNVAVGVNRLNV